MNVDSLSPPKDTPAEIADERFSWITHFGGSFDLVDLVVGRAGAIVDYEAVEGSEYRPFDPNQGNYTLEAFVSARVRTSEIGAIFHHISRHLSDRPKREAIAWNELGVRVLHRFDTEAATVDVDLEGGRAVQHSFVDYTWLGQADALVRRQFSPRVGIFGRARGQLFAVDDAVSARGTQTGAPSWNCISATRIEWTPIRSIASRSIGASQAYAYSVDNRAIWPGFLDC